MLKIYLDKYFEIGEYCNPDYKRVNLALSEFKFQYPEIDSTLELELIGLLKKEGCREFVGDLMYLYKSMPDNLFDELLNTGISYKDPSFNRIFVKPCISCRGTKEVTSNLTQKFKKGDLKTRIGISDLFYWIRPKDISELDELFKIALENITENQDIIETYFYFYGFLRDNQKYIKKTFREFRKATDSLKKVPDGAVALLENVKSNPERLRYAKEVLGWKME